jgi:hypothetical protein
VTLVLETDILARDVFLSLSREDGRDETAGLGRESGSLEGGAASDAAKVPFYHFEENFFHLLPGEKRSVRLFSHLAPEEVKRRLRVRTLAEIPQEGTPPDPTPPEGI